MTESRSNRTITTTVRRLAEIKDMQKALEKEYNALELKLFDILEPNEAGKRTTIVDNIQVTIGYGKQGVIDPDIENIAGDFYGNITETKPVLSKVRALITAGVLPASAVIEKPKDKPTTTITKK